MSSDPSGSDLSSRRRREKSTEGEPQGPTESGRHRRQTRAAELIQTARGLPYFPGQQGGTFALLYGNQLINVSAPGVLKLLGFSREDAIEVLSRCRGTFRMPHPNDVYSPAATSEDRLEHPSHARLRQDMDLVVLGEIFLSHKRFPNSSI